MKKPALDSFHTPPRLLCFLVLRMRVAKPAILPQGKLLGSGPLVFGRIVVALLALGAGQGN